MVSDCYRLSLAFVQSSTPLPYPPWIIRRIWPGSVIAFFPSVLVTALSPSNHVANEAADFSAGNKESSHFFITIHTSTGAGLNRHKSTPGGDCTHVSPAWASTSRAGSRFSEPHLRACSRIDSTVRGFARPSSAPYPTRSARATFHFTSGPGPGPRIRRCGTTRVGSGSTTSPEARIAGFEETPWPGGTSVTQDELQPSSARGERLKSRKKH